MPKIQGQKAPKGPKKPRFLGPFLDFLYVWGLLGRWPPPTLICKMSKRYSVYFSAMFSSVLDEKN